MGFLTNAFSGASSNSFAPQSAWSQPATSQNFQPQIATGNANYNTLAGQLQQQANGQGANPAQAMLNQATNQNVAQGAGMLASQRGITTAQTGREAAQQTANANQQAAGQGAVMRANQQLNAQGIGIQAANQNLGINQGAMSAQNQQITNAQTAQQGQGASIAGQNAQSSQGLIGGILGTFAKGGEVEHYADGGSTYAGEVTMPQSDSSINGVLTNVLTMANGGSTPAWNTLSNTGSNFSYNASQPQYQAPSQQQSANGNTNQMPGSGWQLNFVNRGQSSGGSGVLGGLSSIFKSAPQTQASATNTFNNTLSDNTANMGTTSGADLTNGMGTTAAGTGGMADSGAGAAAASSGAADAAATDAATTAGTTAAASDSAVDALAFVAQGGQMKAPINAKVGGQVPGEPKYPHVNTTKQDTIPAMLTSKEIVLPLTVTQSENPAQAAYDFVAKIKAQEGKPKDDFKGAISRAAKQRKN